ncbi:metallophosphoesterase [Cumulibacter soli]|uniref:metallophosphoesterase n=1 Tax=Cumulibacter soli TaxID=2546344 RepID=UPI00106826AA|nr:metallophosphoesterase [Cumulibacter soli]
MPDSDDEQTTPTGPTPEPADDTQRAAEVSDAQSNGAAAESDGDANETDGDTAETDASEDEKAVWRRRGTLAFRIFLRVIVAIAGVVLGVLIGGHTTADIGPIKVSADLLVGPGETTLRIPPLGALEIEAFDAPIRLEMTMLQVDQQEAIQFINEAQSTEDLQQLAATLESDLKSALITLGITTTIWALVGGIVFSVLLFRRWQDGLIAAGMSVVLLLATAATGFLTFNAQALQQPKYTGLLSQASTIFGNVEDLGQKFADYRQSLVKMVANVSKLYTTVSTLPADPESADTIKVLHISDIHMNPEGFDLAAQLAEQFDVDFVIDTGDLVDWGTTHEAATFSAIGDMDVPYVYIRGNHDSLVTQQQVGEFDNVIVLDESTVELEGITIAGVGDARFSPDRLTYNNASLQEAIEKSAKDFDGYLQDLPEMPDVVLFHDPAGAEFLADSTPLILSGHKHTRSSEALDSDTLLLVQGSTGGAGLRGLENEEPTPLEASILYFDANTHALRAWDNITVGGLGESDVSIERMLAPEAINEAEEEATSIEESEQSASDSAESASNESSSGSASNPSDEGTEPNSDTGSPSSPTTTGAPQNPGE